MKKNIYLNKKYMYSLLLILVVVAILVTLLCQKCNDVSVSEPFGALIQLDAGSTNQYCTFPLQTTDLPYIIPNNQCGLMPLPYKMPVSLTQNQYAIAKDQSMLTQGSQCVNPLTHLPYPIA